MWLVDLERALALLVGQTLGGMLAGPGVSHEEKDCEKWLNSPLLWNGLEDRDPERGNSSSTSWLVNNCSISVYLPNLLLL